MNRFFGTICAFALVLAGCAPTNQPHVGGKPRNQRLPIVVSLSPSATEALGVTQQVSMLAGRTESCNYPPSVLRVPVVAGVKPDYEKIAEIKPTLILVDPHVYTAADLTKIKQVGADVFEWAPKNLDEYRKRLIDLTKIVSGETTVSSYLDRVDAAVGTAKSRAPQKKATLAVIMPDKGGQHMWMGTECFVGEVLRATQVDLIGPKGDKFVPLDAEALIKANPDYLLLASETPTDFLKDPRYATLKAVKGQTAFGVLPDLVLRCGGRVDILIDSLSKKIYGAK